MFSSIRQGFYVDLAVAEYMKAYAGMTAAPKAPRESLLRRDALYNITFTDVAHIDYFS